jgi:hypothetical protein
MPRWLTKTVLSIILACGMLAILSALLESLPYSTTRDSVQDAVAMPGALLAWLFYPAGVHSGGGSVGWLYVLCGGNVLFYTALWYVGIALCTKAWRGRQPR